MDQQLSTYDRNEEHLKLLGIFHYVMAGLDLLGLGAAAVYLGMAVFLPGVIERSGEDVPPELADALPIILGTVGILVVLVSLTMAALTAYAGWSLHQRRNRTLVFVVSVLHLLSMPFGTALGIFTIIVMSRPEVAASFDARAR